MLLGFSMAWSRGGREMARATKVSEAAARLSLSSSGTHIGGETKP